MRWLQRMVDQRAITGTHCDVCDTPSDLAKRIRMLTPRQQSRVLSFVNHVDQKRLVLPLGDGTPIPPPPPQPSDAYVSMARRDPVRRRNAGGITGNAPLIITGGSKRNAEFHYQFTEPGKFKQKRWNDQLDLNVLKQTPIKDSICKLKYRLPMTFCPDEGHFIKPEKAQWLGIWMVLEPHREVNLNPEETIFHVKCEDCVAKQKGGGTNLTLPNDGNELGESQRFWLDQKRMENNMISFIRNRLMANDFSIVVSAEERERLGAEL